MTTATFLLLMGIAHSAQPRGSSDVEELKALEHKIARAWIEGDRASLDTILLDDWTTIDINGRVRTKADVLRDMFGPDAPMSEDVTVDEITVCMLGDVGIVTGRTRWRGGDGATVTLRFTDVAVRRDDR